MDSEQRQRSDAREAARFPNLNSDLHCEPLDRPTLLSRGVLSLTVFFRFSRFFSFRASLVTIEDTLSGFLKSLFMDFVRHRPTEAVDVEPAVAI